VVPATSRNHFGTGDHGVDEEPCQNHVVHGHRLGSHRQVDAVVGDHRVQRVEVGGGSGVHLGDPAVLDDQRRVGVVRADHGDQPQADVLVGEAVEIDALLIHEPDAPDRLLSHSGTLPRWCAGGQRLEHRRGGTGALDCPARRFRR
jgi:hypothetical protein